jgi:hypothetical protein
MKSGAPGRRISPVEVTNISALGFWLFVGEHERFLSFKDFPWFENALIREITHVELASPHHLYWPELDIDLAVDSLTHPEKYPLVSRVQPKHRLQRAKAGRKSVPDSGTRKRLRS